MISYVFFLLLLPSSIASPPELRLRNDLLHDYNPLERPVENNEDRVVVTLGVAFQQIINLVSYHTALNGTTVMHFFFHLPRKGIDIP